MIASVKYGVTHFLLPLQVTTPVEASYEPNKFDVLCDTVSSSLMMLDHAVHEVCILPT